MEHRPADFEDFVADNTDALLRAAYLIVSDLPEAEDLVQETLLKVAGRWHRVRRMKYPVAYARRILVNLALGGADRRQSSPARARRRAARRPPRGCVLVGGRTHRRRR